MPSLIWQQLYCSTYAVFYTIKISSNKNVVSKFITAPRNIVKDINSWIFCIG